MRLAVDDPDVTVKETLYELRVALMDRLMHELAAFHNLDFRDQIVIRDGHWMIQCWVHKYKNQVQAWRALDAGASLDEPGFSLARLLKVATELAWSCETTEERRMYSAVVLALQGKTDALSQAACMWVMCCPRFLEALDKDPACWLEHTVLYVFGMAYLAWDMPGLTDEERSYRIELCEAVLVYSLGGEQLYLPFYDESTKGSEPGLVGILSGKIGNMSSQNLLAFLGNGASRRQFRQQYPQAYAELVELSLNNNDLENFFSLIAQQLGYKPRMIEFEARAQLLDFALQEEHNPERIYQILQSRRKRYDACEFYLSQALAEWNDASAIDPRSPKVAAFLLAMAKSAMRAAKGKYEGVHAQHQKAATGVRH